MFLWESPFFSLDTRFYGPGKDKRALILNSPGTSFYGESSPLKRAGEQDSSTGRGNSPSLCRKQKRECKILQIYSTRKNDQLYLQMLLTALFTYSLMSFMVYAVMQLICSAILECVYGLIVKQPCKRECQKEECSFALSSISVQEKVPRLVVSIDLSNKIK